MPDTSLPTGGGRASSEDPGTPIHDALLADRLSEAARDVAQAQHDADAFRAALDRGQADALEELARQRARELVAAQLEAVTTQRDALERQARWAGDRLAALAAWHSGDPGCQACGEPAPCTTARVLAGAPAPEPAAPPVVEPEPVVVEVQPEVEVAPRAGVVTLEARAVAAEAEAREAQMQQAQAREAQPQEAQPQEAQPQEAGPPETGPRQAVPSSADPVVPAHDGVPAGQDPDDGPDALPDGPPAQAPAGRALSRDGGPAEVPSVPSMKELFSSTRAAGWLDNLLGAKR